MAGYDDASLLLIALMLGAVVVAAGLLIDWRGVGQELPLWAFMRTRGVTREVLGAHAGERGLRIAEMRCAACGSQQECIHRIAAATAAPVADCPNAELFAQPSGLANASRSDGLKPAA